MTNTQPRNTAAGLFAPLDDRFFFMSPFKSLITEGCYRRISTPALGGDQLDGEFQQSIAQAMQAARAEGIERPLVVGAIPFDPASPSSLYVPRQWQFFDKQQARQQAARYPDNPLPAVSQTRPLPAKPEFINMVAAAIEALRGGTLDKVVLSRLLDISTAGPADAAQLLARLVTQNSESYNFHLPLPDGSRLLGASPELLLRKQGNQLFSQPLAGSAKRHTDDAGLDAATARQLLDSTKDRYEHRLVTQAMNATLQSRCTALSVPERPECISTSTLWHLATSIEGQVKDPRDNALSLACLLHPTPALSGFPHQAAQTLLSQLEPFDRQHFGGIVGWCDDQGNGEWVIAIRCGHIQGCQVRLFAGAGIVPDSSPESEWRETGVKLTTMLHAFGMH
ncbi:isochorismate synthase [Biostraticola tofi]|uniref:isochorismate synthase n=1 Tax=Biostraticola tofi TaxID=466109 RepID=A0A4R3YVA8_9GAMM|nr:isochorismate synthase [Biostraticola tofi]TCV95143.1 isochorismate synthase [Biostraticola tofi]